MTIEQRIYSGNRAKEVLENPVFQAVFDDIEQELTTAWKTSPQRDADAREKIHLALTMLNKVKACLHTSMDTGKLAALDLQHKQSLADRTKDWLGKL